MHPLEKRLWNGDDRYSTDDLNRVMQGYYQNDDRLKDIVDSLMLIISTNPSTFPATSILQTPTDLKALVDWAYSLGTTVARVRELDYNTELSRPYQEILNVFNLEPFLSLIEGAALDPKQYVKILEIMQIIRGMVYWAQDVPPYSDDPLYITQGNLVWTTLSRLRNGITEYMLVNNQGEPFRDSQGNIVYAEFPETERPPILLLDYRLRKIMADRLRILYRLGNFEAGIDSDFRVSNNRFNRQFSIGQASLELVSPPPKSPDCTEVVQIVFGIDSSSIISFSPTEPQYVWISKNIAFSRYIPTIGDKVGLTSGGGAAVSFTSTVVGVRDELRPNSIRIELADDVTFNPVSGLLVKGNETVVVDCSPAFDSLVSPCSPGQGSPWTCLDYPRRFPCGFVQMGKFNYIRENIADYAQSIDISRFLNNIENRLLMEESLIQTPFGLFRLPHCEINWDGMVDPTFGSEQGDPLVFVGLHFKIAIQRENQDDSTPIAEPKQIVDIGFKDGVTALEKNASGEINNATPTETPAETWDAIFPQGHQHGQLIGFIQTNDGISPEERFPQFVQVEVSPYVKLIPASDLRDFLSDPTPSMRTDELIAINQRSTQLDEAPEVTHGWTGREILQFLFTEGIVEDSWEPDTDQISLVRASNEANRREWESVIPLGIQILKKPQQFTFDALNGSGGRFNEGWAIRRISSVQPNSDTMFLDDANGDPEDFPTDFVQADALVYQADGGTVEINIIDKLDKVAFLTKGLGSILKTGDVVVFNNRIPQVSLNDVWIGEVNSRSWVDLRTNVRKIVDCEVTEDELASPTQYLLSRELSRESLNDIVSETYGSLPVAIESKTRYNLTQRFWSKASDKYEVTNIGVPVEELKGFLIDYIRNYEQNKSHPYAVGENILISWPEMEPDGLEVSLDRYQRRKIIGNKDRIVLKSVGDFGVAPVLVKHLDSQEHFRYPTLTEDTLKFISERNFSISGHRKLAGSFFLEPLETQIVNDTIKITLQQQRIVREGVTELITLGSVELKWRQASTFQNATGVFKIDGDARYSPITQRLTINYNQIVNFSTDEPGILTLSYSYFDLANPHPVFTWEPDLYALQLAYLADARDFTVADSSPTETPEIVRLEGISINGGQVYVRFNKEDAFRIIDQQGFVETDWIIRGMPWIVIDSVTYDEAGNPIDVQYSAFIVNQSQTITTTIDGGDRNNQVYLPCDQLYGWVDETQSNIHTAEFAPQEIGSARFGFYQKTNFVAPDGALEFETVFRSLNYVLKFDTLDYRWTKPYDDSLNGYEYLISMGVFRGPNGQRKGVTGMYLSAIERGTGTDLEDELEFSNLQSQDQIIYFKDSEIGEDWIPEFIGVLVVVDDNNAQMDWSKTKLASIGYWYNGHNETELLSTIRVSGEALAVQGQLITKNDERWRIGDLPNRYVYRDNTLLEGKRTI